MTIESTTREILQERYEIESTEPELLNENRLIRGAAVLVVAGKSKTYGDKAVQSALRGKTLLNQVQRDKNLRRESRPYRRGLIGDIRYPNLHQASDR